MNIADTSATNAPLPFYVADSASYPQPSTPNSHYDSIAGLLLLEPDSTADSITLRESIFVGHSLPLRHSDALPRMANEPMAWVFGALLLAIAAVCIHYRNNRIRVSHLLAALVDRSAMERIVRDSNLMRHSALIPATVTVAGMAALAATVLMGQGTQAAGLLTFVTIWAAATTLLFLRNGLFRLLGNTFDDRDAVSLYITSNYFYHLAEAAALPLPIMAAIYSPVANNGIWVATGVIISILLIMRLVRGMGIILTFSRYSKFYLFYYLCSLEIVPLIVLIKIIITL
ncbi:MAG: DUF4271 domain-containing protein [Bacteroidales bacterium]|nr:DUF4271 domain-containing protein [Bacteroidales bacterium]